MKYQKKYSTASDYQSDTHEANSISMVSTDTLYYNGTAIQTNTSSGGNIIVEDDGLYQIKDGEIYPVSHPDLSTQPSLLPYRIGKKPVYQVMIPSSEFLEIGSSGIRFSPPSNCEQVIDVIGYNSSNNTSGQYYGWISNNELWWTSGYHTSGQQPDFLIVTYIGISDDYYEYSGSSGPTILRSLTITAMIPAEQSIDINIIIPDSNPDVDSIIGETVITTASDYTTSFPIVCTSNGSSVNAECSFNDTNIYPYEVTLSYQFNRQGHSTMYSPAALNVSGGSVTINLYI